ncbi:MAG: C40 family peptidase [Flavobacteriales bacterium]|nr:C40 family peptidase [Flavobacteriales bacterium]
MKLLLSILFLFLGGNVSAQNPKIDKLEMLFSQRHYKRVYRKSNRLLDNPLYDYSVMPSYYNSLALFQLAQNEFWLSHHPQALRRAEESFVQVKRAEDGTKIFNAHMYEIAWLKNDLISWASDLKRTGHESTFLEVQRIIKELFGEFEFAELPNETLVNSDGGNQDSNSSENTTSNFRMIVVNEAMEHIGVPYVWAGNSPSGFDCSGFTSYVLGKSDMTLSRRAADQYHQAEKLKRKNIQKGDLVFFSNGSGVSHVGIIVSENGGDIQMVHASSSKGIIVTNVDKSSYWSQRLHGFGSYF